MSSVLGTIFTLHASLFQGARVRGSNLQVGHPSREKQLLGSGEDAWRDSNRGTSQPGVGTGQDVAAGAAHAASGDRSPVQTGPAPAASKAAVQSHGSDCTAQPPTASQSTSAPVQSAVTSSTVTGTTAPASGSWNSAAATCLTCGIGVDGPGFDSPEEQRAHFKGDWHRLNMKRKLAKQPPLAESAFEAMLEAGSQVSSISGSDSSDSDSSAEDEDKADVVQAYGGRHGGGAGVSSGQRNRVPQIVFTTADASRTFAVWKCLLERAPARGKASEPYSDSELALQLQQVRRANGPWVVLLLRGGHFAASVFQGRPSAKALPLAPSANPALPVAGADRYSGQAGGGSSSNGIDHVVSGEAASNGSGSNYASAAAQPVATAASNGSRGGYGPKTGGGGRKRDGGLVEGFELVTHKTFHRYVVRAKAGGKQSTQDATGKFAKSAGSRLRRHNEVALQREIVELLASWQGHLAAADRIFVQATSSNLKTLFPAEQTTLLVTDPRIRTIPFITQRPTFAETQRVVRLLSSVFDPAAFDAAQAAQLALEDAAAAASKDTAAAAASVKAVSGGTRGDEEDEGANASISHQQQQEAAAAKKAKQKARQKAAKERAAKESAAAAEAEAAAAAAAQAHEPAVSVSPEAARAATAAAFDAEIARALAEAEAVTARLSTAQQGRQAQGTARTGGFGSSASNSKVRPQSSTTAAGRGGTSGSRQQQSGGPSASANCAASGGGRRVGPGTQPAAAAAARPLTAAEQAARREAAVAAAEARMAALTAAAAAQKLW